jgi:hypothetical protein
MTAVRHCRHCWGDCPGDCLLGDAGMCIHNRDRKLGQAAAVMVGGTRGRMRARLLVNRGWWRRVLWGGK